MSPTVPPVRSPRASMTRISPSMSVYAGIDVRRKRSQVAVVDEGGEVLVSRNVTNGAEPALLVMGGLPAGTPAPCSGAKAGPRVKVGLPASRMPWRRRPAKYQAS
jgi:predicted NBD/HSP70 family sugar kinase